MNEDRDLNRLLDAWFAEGPVQAADRVIDGTASRISRQRQLPAWRLHSWRFPTMSTPLKLVAIGAALLAVLIGGAVFMGGGAAPPTPTPSPTPAPTATPTPTPTPVPATLSPGKLAAGTYIGNPLPGKPMTWTVTVPDGWIGFDEWAVYADVPEGDPFVFVGGPTENVGIPADSCSPAATAPAGSVDELIAAVQARDDWTVSAPVDTSLGGYSGTRIELEVPADVTCENGNDYMVLSTFHAQGPSNRFELWVLDVDGRPLVVMRNSFADTPAELMSQSDDILDSIVITP